MVSRSRQWWQQQLSIGGGDYDEQAATAAMMMSRQWQWQWGEDKQAAARKGIASGDVRQVATAK